MIAEIEGYAAIFNVEDLNGDVISPGAFRKALAKKPPIRMLYQHTVEAPLGRWRKVEEDSRGLWVEGDMILTPSAREVYDMIAGGAIDSFSIGFRTIKANARTKGRYILEAELWEVSVVTFPMAPGAKILRIGPPVPEDEDFTLARAMRRAAQTLSA